MTPDERKRVVDALPCWLTAAELSPPEGDPHQDACMSARDALREYYHRLGRRAYVGVDLIVYYPDAPRFAPDLLVVFDVDPGKRYSWVVSHEGKGLDFVLEVLDRGDRKKDLEHNVVRYAELGIPEYFVYDLGRRRLVGHRLGGGGRYVPVVPQLGRFASEVLQLDLVIEGDRLRFYRGSALLPAPLELIERLQTAMDGIAERLVDETLARQEAEAAREAEKAARAVEEAARQEAEVARQAEEAARQEAEHRLALALAELAQLRLTHPKI